MEQFLLRLTASGEGTGPWAVNRATEGSADRTPILCSNFEDNSNKLELMNNDRDPFPMHYVQRRRFYFVVFAAAIEVERKFEANGPKNCS